MYPVDLFQLLDEREALKLDIYPRDAQQDKIRSTAEKLSLIELLSEVLTESDEIVLNLFQTDNFSEFRLFPTSFVFSLPRKSVPPTSIGSFWIFAATLGVSWRRWRSVVERCLNLARIIGTNVSDGRLIWHSQPNCCWKA